MISYEPLWQTMADRGVSQYKLLKSGIDNKTLDGLKKNKNITLLTLEKLYNILDCTPNDIVTFIPEIEKTYDQSQS
ncbi:DNA-binding Xre family transcriptional regulator [Streptococcus rupicaprae]|uniref:DNA-binding Xre family transcriptional regulator n=1 Tax=Streptococcus rupicaprae TaxID=759619 RepID=A0ABV2FFM2_9STRE